MRYRDLTKKDKNYIKKKYESGSPRHEIQLELCEKFNVSPRTIRRWAKRLELGLMKSSIVNPDNILIYDIETSKAKAEVWWTGKQYVRANQIVEEPKVITICYKWLGENQVHALTWDENQSDEKMLKEFLKVYNQADMIIGQNNNNFDNRWINARAAKYNLFVNMHVKSFDIMKQTKKHFRLLGYGMGYITKFLKVPTKLEHEGAIMWEMVQNGTKAQQKEYLKKMVDYNRQDIIATEAMYLRLRKYMGHKMHFGTLTGKEKYTCPSCGGSNVELFKSTTTAAGTPRHIMRCKDDDVQYVISNRDYLKFLENE